jgi:hypothetical protein
MIRFFLACAATVLPGALFAQNNNQQNAAGAYATFSEGRLVHDVTRDGKKGLEVHHKIRVVGMLGREVEVACYFYYANGTALKDTNQAFHTVTGEVSVGEKQPVQYADATFNDFTLFIPHTELHAPDGTHDMKTNCEAFDAGRSLGKSVGWLTFTLRQGGAALGNNLGNVNNAAKIARFGAGSMKHDVFKDGVKGLEIHHPLTASGMLGRELEVTCFFYYEGGDPLKDFNQRYYTLNGNVSVMDKVTVNYAEANWADFTHFIPYDELHLSPGKTDLKLNCEAFDAGVSIGKSDWLHLWYTK